MSNHCRKQTHMARLSICVTAMMLVMTAGCSTLGLYGSNTDSTTTTQTTAQETPSGPVMWTPPVASPPDVPDRNEIVLENGTQITVTNKAETITVTAGPGLLRTFKWDGTRRWAIMKPREKRWAGSLGIHYAGKPPEWNAKQGFKKLEYEEGQLHFSSAREASIWMRLRDMHFVNTSNGLVIGWKFKKDKHTFRFEVWQFYINGNKPKSMAGADTNQIDIQQVKIKTGQ